jgi:hypothetical protein
VHPHVYKHEENTICTPSQSGARVGVVVEVLRYKPEDCGFEKKYPDGVTGFFH